MKCYFSFVKIRSMQFGLADLKRRFFNTTFDVKCAHKNFKVFILDSKAEIPHQRNGNVIKLAS